MRCPAPLSACGNHSGEAERRSGIGLKLFGFVPEPVFTFIPESCSGSTRNTVRNHPGIAFTLPRIPQARPQVLVARTAQLQDQGKLSDAHAALAKAFTTSKARETVSWARECGDRRLSLGGTDRWLHRQSIPASIWPRS